MCHAFRRAQAANVGFDGVPRVDSTTGWEVASQASRTSPLRPPPGHPGNKPPKQGSISLPLQTSHKQNPLNMRIGSGNALSQISNLSIFGRAPINESPLGDQVRLFHSPRIKEHRAATLGTCAVNTSAWNTSNCSTCEDQKARCSRSPGTTNKVHMRHTGCMANKEWTNPGL